MDIMGGRHNHLLWALEGYKRTGIPLIEYDGTQLLPLVSADDVGMYYLIPKLAFMLGISIDQAIPLFFNTISWLACAIGVLGFYHLYKGTLERLIALLSTVLFTLFICRQTLDVYRLYPAIALSLVPWCLYFVQKKYTSPWFYLYAVFAGLSIGFANYIRSHAGTAVLIFIIILITTHQRIKNAKKVVLIGLILGSITLVNCYTKYLYNQHREYAVQHFPAHAIDQNHHILWHAVYVGFGFLNNELGIRFDDKTGHQKALEISPSLTNYPNQESEQILRHEVWNLFTHHTYFFLLTIWAKIGVLLWYLLIFANVGLIAAYCYPKDWRLELAFAAAIGFSSLFGILTIPFYLYCLGFITLALLYGIISVNYALEHHVVDRIIAYIKKRS